MLGWKIKLSGLRHPKLSQMEEQMGMQRSQLIFTVEEDFWGN